MSVKKVADLFCGAGGSSTGILDALRDLGEDVELIAVNHWHVAIATHKANHPRHAATTFCTELDSTRPIDLVPRGHLDLLWASPECTDFSRAKGGKPVNDQRRMSPWLINRWLADLTVDVLLVENVPEFREWGPLLADGRRDTAHKGLYFEAWINSLWAMGYDLEWRLLNAADYGDATTRTRFFLQARKDGRPVTWPEPSHARHAKREMFGSRPRWRAAAEVIDWSDPGPSLLGRKKPLSIKTRLRIARGLERFGGPLAPHYIRLLDLPAADHFPDVTKMVEPFVTVARGGHRGRAVDQPLPTITTMPGMRVVIPTAEPFTFANRENNVPRSADEPIAGLTTATGGGIAAVTPFVSSYYGQGDGSAIAEPVPAVTATPHYLVEPTAEPFVLAQGGGGEARPVSDPLPTIVAKGAESLVQPHLVTYYGNSDVTSVDAPLPTVTSRDRFALASPQVITLHGTTDAHLGSTSKPVDEPLSTITGGNHHYLSTPLAVPYGPKAEARPTDEPLPTILTKDRLAVATPEAFIVPGFAEREGQAPRIHALDEPVPAILATGHQHLVAPMVVQMGHTERDDAGTVRDVADPMPTVTTRINLAVATAELADGRIDDVDPRRLVEIDGQTYLLDIRFRMLRNRELAAAMGFPADYRFTGKVAEVTAQIGNAVCRNLAKALAGAALSARPVATKVPA